MGPLLHWARRAPRVCWLSGKVSVFALPLPVSGPTFHEVSHAQARLPSHAGPGGRHASRRPGGAGPDVPGQAGEPDGPVPGGRPVGRHCAHLQHAARQGARPAGAGGEPGRRQRRDRGTEGAERAQRRPPHLPGLAQRADPGADGDLIDQVQARRLPPDPPHRAGPHGHLLARRPAGEERRRTGGLRRQGGQGRQAADLRQRGPGLVLSPAGCQDEQGAQRRR